MKLCEIYDEGCSSLSFDYTCKIRDGTELEMETQSDTRHNLKTTPTPTPTVSLHCEKLPPPCHLFITKKKCVRGRDIIAALSNDRLVSEH